MSVARVESRESKPAVRSYRDLQVWQKSMQLVGRIYEATAAFPKEEQFGLTSQLRRAAVSLPSNIAEGSSRRSTAEFLRYINIATGSLAEMETQLLIASQLGYVADQFLRPLLASADEIGRMLQGLHQSLNVKSATTRLPTLDSNH